MTRLAIIGLGNMGGSIARALGESGEFELHFFDLDKSRMEDLEGRIAESLEDAVDRAEVVLIAIKPQFITSEFLRSIDRKDRKYISIAAGVTLSRLEKGLSSANICRFMPNLAASKKKAVTAMCFKNGASQDFKVLAGRIAESFGSAFELDESQFSAFIGISGSLIAFALEFIHSSAMAGVREGIPYPRAMEIVRDTMNSATALLEEGECPASIIPKVCSASGTTIEGMLSLDEYGFSNAIEKAVRNTTERSRVMEKIS